MLTDEDDRVLGIHHNVAERDGKRLDVYCCIVYELPIRRSASSPPPWPRAELGRESNAAMPKAAARGCSPAVP